MIEATAKPTFWQRAVYALACLGIKLSGWRVPGRLPDEPKFIIIATHTSNWDFALALLGMAYLTCGFSTFHFCWMGKKELFWGPQGWFLRKTGGIPIDRSAAHDVVQDSITAFARHERIAMIITPEGTRKRGRRWKTGFYHIAQGAGVPIVCAFLDYRRKIVGPGFVLTPSGDMVADMCRLRDFYQDMPARYPDQVGEVWVPGMETCQTGGGYAAWLAANGARLGVN